ncbi:NIMA (never in mitosis protein a)-related kinase 2 [Trichosporon asahii var. asahii CBS 8904]|uniref:non-specific serine/threonine protein kinase n=1 Tax=Trichosporon asahii var. asahii (strain CBS 8904) TaxID=1220162 RepID=K1VZL4_TRIAC|nr:NIMA (never in mitosis protein a)-related kinase 2 [Trichosporon asahii var. asahii CBS 8904]
MIQIPGYQVKDELGVGGFGRVYRARRASDHKCAIKVQSEVTTTLGTILFRNEIKALRQLSHPNVVEFLDVIKCNDEVHLVMEFCDGGDLRTLMEDHLERGLYIHELDVKSIFVQLLLALHHCHQILLTTTGSVKLADFGLCKILHPGKTKAHSLVGTPGYVAPEVSAGAPYDAKADLFSLGCVLYEMCALDLPTLDNKAPCSTDSFIPKSFSSEMEQTVTRLLSQQTSVNHSPVGGPDNCQLAAGDLLFDRVGLHPI